MVPSRKDFYASTPSVGSLANRVGLDQRSYSTLGPVSAWMGDRLRAGKLFRYVTCHPGQLSLAIPT